MTVTTEVRDDADVAPLRAGHTGFASVRDRVHMQRLSDRKRDDPLQGILCVFEPHAVFDQTEVLKEPHAVGIDWKDLPIQCVHHHAASRLQAYTR